MSDVMGAGRLKLGWGAAREAEGGAVLGIGGGEARREDGSSRLRGAIFHSCSEKLVGFRPIRASSSLASSWVVMASQAASV
jgi:hypothetical protein